VLIIDDSAIVRKILSEAVAAEPDMEVVGTAPDPYVAREKILALRPDVLTLDIEMPRMDGLTFLKRLMHDTPIPTIIVSSLGQASCAATLEALRCGAVDVLAKPSGPYSVGDLRLSLAAMIRGAAGAHPRIVRDLAPRPLRSPSFASSSFTLSPAPSPALEPAIASYSVAPAHLLPPVPTLSFPSLSFPTDPRTVIAIGASTGGTVAIQEILLRLPADMPAIVISQHIPAGFSHAFSDRLNKICPMEVREAVDGDVLRRGLVLLAPGDHNLLLHRTGSGYTVQLQQGPQACYLRPSVDVMFVSVAHAAGSRSVGVLLTGMGADGAKGMLALKRAGAPTIAQDEASCVVYGMPREAVRLGAVSTIASLADIPGVLTRTLKPQASAASHLHRAAQETQP